LAGIFLFAAGAGVGHAQPANDLLADARILSGASGQVSDSTVGAGKEPGEPNHAGDQGGHSIWYSWTAPASGPAVFDTVGSGFDTLLAVYTGSELQSLNLLAENDDIDGFNGIFTSRVFFDAVQGEVYWIAIDGYGGRSGPTRLNWASGSPPNDNFSSAEVLSGPNGTVGGSTEFATKESGEPNHAGDSGGHSIWYTWTAPASGPAVFDTAGSGLDTLLAVYTGSDLQSLVLQAENDDIDFFNGIYTSRVFFNAVQAEVYWIAIDGYGAASGSTRLNWASGGPSNDNFGSAQVLSGPDGTVDGSTLFATIESGEPNHAGIPGGHSIWYEWSPPTDGWATISLGGSSFDTALAVYTGESVDALKVVAQNDDFSGRQSQVQFDAEAAVTYRIAVDGYLGAHGQVILSYSEITEPVIVSQPQSLAVLEAVDVTLSVFAVGARPFSYQWSFNEVNLDFATNPTLVLSNVSLAQAGDYQVVVSNAFGSATSIVASLTVVRAESPGVQRCWTVRENVYAAALAVDNAGNVCVTGTEFGTSSNLDYATVKYAPNGTALWAASYNGPDDLLDSATAIAVDSTGNVYVTGASGSTNGDDFATVKYDSNGSRLWAARYNGPNDSDDHAFAVAVDNAGKVFVSGDAATVKYDGDFQLWAVRYTNFSASAMVLDSAGNVCLAGTAPTNNVDFLTAKYDTEGRLLWMAYENGPHRLSEDRASVIAVDIAGNVYVAGPSSGACCPAAHTGEGNDSFAYLTVKYDANGHRLWTARYTFPGDYLERVTGIGVDAGGNVYVTGETFGTVKYDPNGNQLWFSRVQSESASGSYSRALAVDPAGDAYVTGSLQDTLGGPDYLTAKYEANGSVTWRARFRSGGEPRAVAVDTPGNVYVSGSSTTLKYAQVAAPGLPVITSGPLGATVLPGTNVALNVTATGADPLTYRWRHNGVTIPGAADATLLLPNVQLSDYGDYAVEVSNAVGSVTSPSARVRVLLPVVITSQPRSRDAVAGEQVEFRVNATGYPLYYQWRLNGVDLPGATEATLLFTNVLGFHAGDYTVAITNDLSGATSLVARLTVRTDVRQVWQDRFPGSGFPDQQSVAIKVDSQGNAYVAGSSFGPSGNNDYVTRRYGPDGGLLWSARYNGPDNNTDDALALAVDDLGNVYVTGDSYGGAATGFDTATVKYDADGNQLWVARYDGPGSGEDVALAVTVDGTGNVYVSGYSFGSGSGYDYATVKYGPDGSQLWAARYNGPGNGTDVGEAIAVDSAGNVYVTGYSYGGNTTTNDYATIKYDANGTQLWVARYNGPGNGIDIPFAIAVDNAGNAHVTGRSFGSGTASDYATIKYATNGTQLWLARYNGPGNGTDFAFALALDGAGNVYVTGQSFGGTGNSFDYGTVKYGPNGNQLWAARYNGPASGNDFAFGLAFDGTGNVCVTGGSYGGALTTNDIATVKYSTNGTQLWAARYDGSAHLDDIGRAIAVDSAGGVYVAGESAASGGDEYVILKYLSNTRPTVALTSPTNNSTFILPVTINFTVTTSDSEGPIAKVELFDLGNKIGESFQPPFTISWTNPPPGSHLILARAADQFGATATSPSVFVSVLVANHPPVIGSIPVQAVDEGTQLAMSIPAIDPDVPPNNLTFSLAPTAPAGATIHPTNGFFTWTPTEAQGPATNMIQVIVTDDGSPNLSTTQIVTVVIREVNTAPMLLPVPNQTAYVLSSLRVTNAVIDPDFPANRMTFQLLAGAPIGSRIHPSRGVFSWTPGRAQASITNFITVVVTDDGDPPLSATNSFSVLVSDYLELTLGETVLRAGQSGSVSVTMTSSAGVTNLSFLLEALEGRATNFVLEMLSPDVQGSFEPSAPNRSFINYNAAAGQSLIGSRPLGGLGFTTSSNKTSAIIPLSIYSLAAVQANGAPMLRTIANNGRVVFVGTNALLEALIQSNGQRTLTLYGKPQTSYILESTTDLAAPTLWRAEWQGAITNLLQVFHLPNTNQTIFYRARE
jgi:uncharacterized delta-60 repeat protein